jgi:hypothetical protein
VDSLALTCRPSGRFSEEKLSGRKVLSSIFSAPSPNGREKLARQRTDLRDPEGEPSRGLELALFRMLLQSPDETGFKHNYQGAVIGGRRPKSGQLKIKISMSLSLRHKTFPAGSPAGNVV